MTTGNTVRPMGITMSKVSTKADQALASSPSGSLLPVTPGSTISGAAASRSRTPRRRSNGQASFSAHLKNAQDEQAGGSQDHAAPRETAAHASQTTSKGPADNQARHAAAQTTDLPSATVTATLSSQIAQATDTAPDQSTVSQAKKATSNPDTATDSAPESDLTSQSLLTDILSQTLGFQQSLPPSAQAQGPANQTDAAAAANPSSPLPTTSAPAQMAAIQQAPVLPSGLQVTPATPSDATATTPSTFAAILAQIPDTQQATSANAQNNVTAAPTQMPDSSPQILVNATLQPATTTLATAPNNNTASTQTPDSPQILVSAAPQPTTTTPTTAQNSTTAAPTQTPENQGWTDTATQPATATPTAVAQNSPTIAATQTPNSPQIVAAPASPLGQSALQAAATLSSTRSHASHDTSSVQEDIATVATASAASVSTSPVRQSASANQIAQHRGPTLAALSPLPDDATDPVSSLTPLPDSTDGSAAQSGGHGGTPGESASTDDNRNDANSQTASQTTTGLNLPLGIVPSGSFATTLNDAGSAPQGNATPKEAGTSHETDSKTIAPPVTVQSDDGSTSLSMTIMTDDSTPVHVRFEGTDGLTTGVFLQSEDVGTARHLADNKHELVAALSAAGVDVSNLKIDVVTASSNNGDNFQNQSQNQNADGTAYNGGFSGSMFGGSSGQNGQQSYGGNAWSTNSVMSDHGAGDPEAQSGSHSIKPSGPYAGGGVNITA
ncbi:hypothetical protein ACMAUO_16165 [Gluconacetobacter sp. Hr-1-5]|uniref:hypothetical protein n=1 Tax=Gluconacetobacter sp. Hr-1-5 TaxID=3395370 RepID=UPI003B51F148